MSESNFVHKDNQEINPVQVGGTNEKETDVKSLLLHRTVGASLITALVTFVITTSILIYSFNAFYLPSIKSQNENAIAFDQAAETKTAINKLELVIKELKDNYLEELTDAQILEAMTSGLPSGLENPYTYYMSAEDYSANQEAMSGKYVGIGCTVRQTEGVGTEVVEVIQDSPAQIAGLLPGDVLLTIDEESVQTVTDPNEIAAKVKGVEGTSVVIGVYRPSTKENLKFSIVRRMIKSKNVTYKMLDSQIGYVLIKTFAEGVPKDFTAAMDELQKQGAKHVVFDLRYNSGGNAQVMIEMLEYLLPADTLLASIKGRENGAPFEIKWITKGGVKVPETMRYSILTNEHTASASEFFSGCLRDYKKATLIGKNTYGKGSGTKLYELPDGSAVNITMFKYYLPNGESIEGTGLKPDIEIELSSEAKLISIEILKLEQDTQLQKAIEVLRQTTP